MAHEELLVLRQRPGWDDAIDNLRAQSKTLGPQARAEAHHYGQVYAGRRGAMVVDVVASRQRRYQSRVLPLVRRWESQHGSGTLKTLLNTPPDAKTHGLRPTEPHTMQTIAKNLLALSNELDLNEDHTVRSWADSVQGLEHAHTLDPVVGAVPGITPTVFVHLRMRCGANAIKPTLRTALALQHLGFGTPANDHAIITIARAAAAEIGVDLPTLDQLLRTSPNT